MNNDIKEMIKKGKPYLFNGIRSDAPVVGIVPQRLLFDNSLYKKMQNTSLISVHNRFLYFYLKKIWEGIREHVHNFQARNTNEFPWDTSSEMIIIKTSAKWWIKSLEI